MADGYRLYRLDGMGQIADAELIKARDDDDAIRQAEEIAKTALKCEVWQGGRLVMKLDRRSPTV